MEGQRILIGSLVQTKGLKSCLDCEIEIWCQVGNTTVKHTGLTRTGDE